MVKPNESSPHTEVTSPKVTISGLTEVSRTESSIEDPRPGTKPVILCPQSRKEEKQCEPPPKLSALVETGQAESSIQVPLQRAYRGEKSVIPASLADTLCSELGIGRLLQTLNDILGTSYNLDDTPSLSSLLNQCISRNYDFGTAYGHLRQSWYDDLSTIQDNLRTYEKKDREMRRNALVGDQIVGTQIPPRRVWDLFSNRVVPWWVTKEKWPQPISHAWMEGNDRSDIRTPINGKEWPVPIPTGVDLKLIRIEMLNLGLEYVWLDVLCLRQKDGPGEDLRAEEWKVDVPTIGYLYRVVGVVVCYLSGLGRPFTLTAKVFQSHHWWFNRAWTLQEVAEDRIIAGDTPDGPLHTEPQDEEGKEIVKKFRKQLQALDDISPDSYNIFDVLAEMQKRQSAKAVDKIAGMAFCLESATIPAYYEDQSLEDAWTALVNTVIPWFRGDLFFGFPEPGTGNKKWRPSWDQAMAMPRQKGECGVWVGRDEENGNDWCQGYCIEKGTVRGLDAERVDRRGELTVIGANGKTHAFQITALHHYLIPEDTYTIIGAHIALENWVVGRRLSNNWFEKVSVFTMPNSEERKRLHDLEVTKELRNYLV
ncbi:uncharacterized protein EV420DRAFT_1030671 [Desarmillaria tabescens]|uniref:Heterokaryon incompatibility domain-containing protein n=1 Tax=Armillaria tabescens TaxID=1929756 RepID=A0AA39ITI3_ARMTA|nr:uncharacterized protein EV420DRAFT_1030671 [Desarmillaria tabescens]KAK0430210.1 hypothetical protein EV420DRAFT_1030671 [Desarmillaria tabescens]